MKRLFSLWRKRKHRRYILDKRQRFATQTLVLTLGLLITQLIWEDYRFIMVIVLSILSYFLTAWSLTEDIEGIEWLLLFILPVFFTASVSLFYFLLPARWSIRVVILSVFAIGTYAILLIENIYNVAVKRSIQLLRAAQSVGLLIALVVIFLTTNIVFSLRSTFWQNMFLLSAVAFVLGLQSLWSTRLAPIVSKNVFLYSLITALGIGELTTALSFWPIRLISASLLVAAAFYTLIGLFQQHILDRLFVNTCREYVFVFVFTLIVAFLTTKWG